MSASATVDRSSLAPERPRVGTRPAGRRYLALGVLAVAPVVVVGALRLPLINQLNYADAWFYTGYAFTPEHHFAIFGWNYFSVRFPPILAIGGFERVFGAGDGYVLLRYLLAVACGGSVYLCVRRFAGMAVALGAALLLYLDPFFSRMLLWDYSGFVETAGGVVGVALWFWAADRRLRFTILPGIALAVAVFANALVGTAVFVLLLVDGVAALRGGRGEILNYLRRLGVLLASAVLVFVVGYLSYLAILGSLTPDDLIRPTIEFFGENNQKSAPYQHAVSSWILSEPRIWAPVVTSLALIAVLGRRLLGRDLLARIAQVCILYTAFLWLYRFAVTSSVVETWWAYSVTVVATAPAVGVLLAELGGGSRGGARVAVVCGAYAVAALVIRNATNPVGEMYAELGTHRALVAALLAIGVAAALACALRTRLRLVPMASLAVVLAVMAYAPSVLDARGTTGIFVTRGAGAQEWTAYKAAQRFMNIVRNYDSPSHRVFLWFPGVLGYVSLTWADLPQYGDTLNQIGVPESIGQLTPLGAARLASGPVKYVMILTPDASELAPALAALSHGGEPGVMVRTGELEPHSLSYALYELAR